MLAGESSHIRVQLAPRARFPEIVVDAVGGKEAAEGHLDAVADCDFLRLAVGHLAQKPAAALEIDHHVDGGRIKRIGQAVQREGGDAGGAVRERIWFHLIARPALEAYALGRQLRGAAR